MEKQQITMMVILDLLATFDMVDHNNLLDILQNHYQVTDNPLQWFKAYVWPHQFKVCIGNKYSRPQ